MNDVLSLAPIAARILLVLAVCVAIGVGATRLFRGDE